MAEQTFSNHTKYVPAFHFFVIPALALNLIWSIYHLWKLHFSFEGFVGVLLAAALAFGFLYARIFALSVQDRVIRLEERMRLMRLLPDDLRPRIDEFTVSQLVALRFACDEELPVLARKVLAENLRSRKAIKQLVKTWRPDYQRA
jgi:hypothetical protein